MKLNTADIVILAAAAFVGLMVLKARKSIAATPAAPQIITSTDWTRLPINGFM